eukprot:1156248-Pelagomonas_calceolata.AAC.2
MQAHKTLYSACLQGKNKSTPKQCRMQVFQNIETAVAAYQLDRFNKSTPVASVAGFITKVMLDDRCSDMLKPQKQTRPWYSDACPSVQY